MCKPVQRFLLTARPARDHRIYRPWETADICLLVSEGDHEVALEKLAAILEVNRWELLRFDRKDTLIEERVQEAGGDIWEAYKAAQESGYHLSEFPQHFAAGSHRMPTAPPRFNESRVDLMVADAGGRRLTADECGTGEQNADYVIGEYVVELKELREEVLADDKLRRQQKLAELLIPYYPYASEIPISRRSLRPDDARRFDDLVGAPIQRAVKKAGAQIRATKSRLGLATSKGALILLNSGSYTLTADQCFSLAARYASKDTTQIHEVISIQQSYRTNSFDCETSSQFSPKAPRSEFADRMFNAWSKQVRRIMDDWARAGFRNTDDSLEPPVPIHFVARGRVFSWEPALPRPSWISDGPSRT